MVSARESARLRRAQAGVARLVRRDLEAFWASLDLQRPEDAREELIGFTPVLVAYYGDVAGTVAADWYDEARAAEQVAGRFRAAIAAAVAADVVQATVRRAAGHLFTDAPALTLDALVPPAEQYALDAGRRTVVEATRADPAAVGWRRVTGGSPCEFCEMLAGRGGVYREETASFASHKHCACTAAPEWDPDAPEVPAGAYAASRGD
jgi:hypothetical protein